MKRLVSAGLVLACLGLGGCVAAVVGGGGGGNQARVDERSASGAAADAAITADVKAGLSADPALRSLAVQVDTQGGNVTLKGTVKAPAQRDSAERIARRVKGVKAVRNQLVVKG